MKRNVCNIRIKTNDFLYCFQCLLQNGIITVEEKNNLVRVFKDCLSNETISDKKEIRALLEDIFYKSIPMTFKQQIEKLLDVIEID